MADGNNATLDEFFQLSWTSNVTIGSFKWWGPSGHPGYAVTAVTLQHWNGSSWVTDASAYAPTSYTGSDNNDWTYTYSTPITTTRIRAVLIYSATPSWPNQFCSEWEVFPPVGPPAPASITVPATDYDGNYTISWASSSGATYYELQEDTNASFSAPTTIYTGASTSHNVSGHSAGTYYYRVRAGDTNGTSAWVAGSNGCVVTLPPAMPATITVPATSATGNFNVTWTASTGATGYDLEESSDAAFTSPTLVVNNQNVLSFNVTGKTSGTWYYRVLARNVAGASAWRAGANGCQIVPPAAPASITVPATSATGSYPVSWASSAGATTDDLEEDTSATFSSAVTVYSGANTSFNVTGKTSGTYYYRVRASNSLGYSTWTAGANGCQIVPPGAPSPIVVPATSSTGTFSVSWSAPPGAVTFELQEDTSPVFSNPTILSPGGNTSFMRVNMTNGTYYYRVRAVNGAGAGPWETDSTGCTVGLAPPSAPASVSVPTGSSSGSYTVSWTSVTGATSYELEEATDSGFSSPTVVYSGSTLNWSASGKSNGTYYYRVRAGNTAGWSGWTAGANGCVVNLSAPGSPASIWVPSTSNSGNFTVNWSAVSGADRYELEEATDTSFSSSSLVYSGPASHFTATGRSPGTYYYRVRSSNPIGASSWTVGSNGCVVSGSEVSLAVVAGLANPAATNEAPGATDVPMLQLRFTAGVAEAIALDTLTVHASGSGDDSAELGDIELWRDIDGDGAVSVADVQVDTAQQCAANDGTVSFTLSGEPTLNAGDSRHYLVRASFEATAANGSGFVLTVTPGSDVTAQGAVSFTAVTPSGSAISGGTKTIALWGPGSVSVSVGGNNPAATTRSVPAQQVTMAQWSLRASSMEPVTLSTVRVHGGGSAMEVGSVSVRLFIDNDGDGTGDSELGSAQAYNTDNGSVTFTGLSVLIPAGDRVVLVVAYDFSEGASLGTYRVSLDSSSDLTLTGTTSGMGISATGLPVQGGTITAAESTGHGNPAFFFGDCGGHGSGTPLPWALPLLALAAVLVLVRRRTATEKG